jgi:HAE1 family hydrophobic/amphiphilic exporter-1
MQPGDNLRAAPRESLGLRLARFSIRHPVTTCMVFVSFLVLGGISITRIPLVLQPDIRFPFIEVFGRYPNATPGQVQEAIVKPIEEALATLPNVQRMGSGAREDSFYVFMEFNWGQDVEILRTEVREKIDQIRNELPADLERVAVQTWGTSDFPVIEGQLSSKRDLSNSYDFLDAKIKKPLERLPGVGEVGIWGTQRREVDIYLRIDDIKRYRVDVGSLFRRLDSVNTDVSLGRVRDRDLAYSALSRGVLGTLEEIRDFPVNDRGLRLRDVADIYFDSPLRTSGRRLNGREAVGFYVRKTSAANTVEVVTAVRKKIEEIKRDPALEGISVQLWFDSGEQITKALAGLLEAGSYGAILAVIVIYLYLRKFAATLAIGFAIPFSMITTVGCLYMLGKTLNVLSMMGLMLAAGMLVDNAVVVLESIYQNLEQGRDRVTAAYIGTKEVLTAVVAATLSSIIIFVPLVFGRDTSYSVFLSDTGTSIMVSLLWSLFISLTLIPLGVAKFFRIDAAHHTRFDAWITARIPQRLRLEKGSITRWYVASVAWTMRHRYLNGFVLVPAVFVASFLILKKIPDNSPEAQDLGNLSINYEFSENFHYKKIEKRYVEAVEQYLNRNRLRFKIKDISSDFGNGYAYTNLYFDKDRLTLDELKKVREEIQKGLPVVPGAEIRLGRQEGAEAQTWLSVNLNGDDPTVLLDLAREARKRLKARPNFTEVHTEADRGRQEVQIKVNRDLARKYNISTSSIGGVLGIVLRGQQIRGFRTPEGEIDLYVRLLPGDREDMSDLKSIVVGGGGPDGREIELAQVADFHIIKTPAAIRRENRKTFTWISVNYSGEKRDEGKTQFEEVMKSLDYPPGYGWSYSFWQMREDQEDQDFLFSFLLALFMVYFVMAALFESITHPFAIMLSLPFGLVGVAWMLYLTGTPFNIMSKIGLMVLVGVVVNNGIVLIDHVNNLRRAGSDRVDAILQGCRDRLRPIMMTATTTVVGLLPLAIGDSGLFDLRYFPLARTIMGGLISSTVLTLIVLPTYYSFFDDLAEWVKSIWRESEPVVRPLPTENS